MADTIKIGSLDISAFKVGSSDCKIYLGSTLLYSGGTPPTPPTPTLQWVSYNEGDAIPSENVYKTYGFRIPTQTVYDIAENGKYFEIDFYSEEKDQQHHPVSNITFTLYSEGFFLTINGSSQEISYDPSSDEYLEIIFSDYGADYNYNISDFKYGEEDDASQVYDFPIDMDLYEEYQPTLQWVTFNAGDTIPSSLDVYGVSGISEDLLNTYGGSGLYIQFARSKAYIECYIYNSDSSYCADGSELATDPMEIIFSNRGCSDFINQGATVSGTIQLLIYT